MLHEHIKIIYAPVSQKRFEVHVPSAGCSSRLQAASLTTMERMTVLRLATPIDEHASGRSTHFVKIDTEGHERTVPDSSDV